MLGFPKAKRVQILIYYIITLLSAFKLLTFKFLSFFIDKYSCEI